MMTIIDERRRRKGRGRRRESMVRLLILRLLLFVSHFFPFLSGLLQSLFFCVQEELLCVSIRACFLLPRFVMLYFGISSFSFPFLVCRFLLTRTFLGSRRALSMLPFLTMMAMLDEQEEEEKVFLPPLLELLLHPSLLRLLSSVISSFSLKSLQSLHQQQQHRHRRHLQQRRHKNCKRHPARRGRKAARRRQEGEWKEGRRRLA